MLNIQKFKKSEKGNALFLILIAVALFAALSYAITQSGRGGGGIDREQALIAASQLTQYAAGLRTTVTRMAITGSGTTAINFGTSADDDDVFDTSGGGAIEQEIPSGAAATATSSYEYLDATHATDGWYIEGIGADTQTSGREVMVVADDINATVCGEINRGLGLDETSSATILTEATAVDLSTALSGAGAANNAGTFAIYNDQTTPNPQAFACVLNGSGGDYTYYHALIEQ